MTFLFPLGLISLAALPLIVVLHLIRRRRRRVRVPSLQFWNLVGAPVQRKRRRLPLTLLLLLHLLVAALLGLTLGRPLLPGIALAPTNTIVVLDTSTSMAAADAQGAAGTTRWSAAQAIARLIFSAARPGDRIGLVTLSSTPRLLGRGGPEAAPALQRALATLQPAGPDGDLAGALSLAMASAEQDDEAVARTRIVVLTDPSFVQRGAPPDALTVAGELEWRVFGTGSENVAIVAFASRPTRGGGHQLYARVANLGSRTAARRLSVIVDGADVETEPVRLNSGGEAEWSWPIPAGARVAEARLSGGDAAPVDDHVTAVLSGGARQRVQLVSAEPTPLERSLRAQPGLDVTLATPTSYRHDPAADLLVLVGFVPQPLPPIPTLIVAPPAGSEFIRVGDVQPALRADAALDSRFAAIDLRSVVFARVGEIEVPAWAGVAVAAGDVPLVLTGIFENHPRMIWTFDPAASNLAGRLAFPLLTAASLRTLVPLSGGALSLGQPAPQALVAPDGTTLPAGAVLAKEGLYRWTNAEGSVAVNAVDAGESDLKQHPRPSIRVVRAAEQEILQDADRHLWRFLLWAALALLMVEWLYVHRHDLRSPGSSRTGRGTSERRPRQARGTL